jgi:hypothetical protein
MLMSGIKSIYYIAKSEDNGKSEIIYLVAYSTTISSVTSLQTLQVVERMDVGVFADQDYALISEFGCKGQLKKKIL